MLGRMDQPVKQTLVDRAVAGDGQAFAKLIEAHYDQIYKVAWKWCGNGVDAEDIAQEVCIKLGQSIAKFSGKSKFSTWLYRITLNTARDNQRKRKYEGDLSDADDMAADVVAADKVIENNQLWQMVSRLKPKERDAILLVYSEGLSHAEAGEIMDCKEGTVSWQISEAKKHLKKWLKSDG